MTPTFCGRLACLLITALTITPACGRLHDEDDASKKPASNSGPTRTPNGDPIVRLDSAAQTRIALKVEAAAATTVAPDLVAYGRLEADPAETFVLRAPVPGTVRTSDGQGWPRLGESLPRGAVVGAIEPRLTPAEQIDLTHQLGTARAELAAASSAATAAKAAYERTRVLNADNKNVSDRAVEEAAARLAAEDAHVQTVTDTVALLDASLHASSPAVQRALTIERTGEVVEVLAQPGEAVEPGAPLLRLADFDRLFARVDLPVGVHVSPGSTPARIVAVGYEDTPVVADLISVSASLEPASQGQSVVFRLRSSLAGLRPGVAATARIPTGGPPRTGVAVPASAIVRVEGQTYVFVQTAPNEFVRKAVPLDQATDTGYLATSNVTPGDRLVVQGAQMLLSEEFKSRISTEG